MSVIFTNEWPSESHVIKLWCKLVRAGRSSVPPSLRRFPVAQLAMSSGGRQAQRQDRLRGNAELYCRGRRWVLMEGCAGTVRWRRAVVPLFLFFLLLFFFLLSYIILKSISICIERLSSVEEVQENDANYDDADDPHHDHHLAVLPPVLVL